MELLARRLIRDIPDFPKAGILFKDITPVVQDARAFRQVIERMTEYGLSRAPDAIAAIESRGFIFGAPLALALNCGFIPVRKLGKLPGETIREEYALEYGSNTVEMQKESVQPGQRVLLVDDLLATGGTAAAAGRITERMGGEVVGCLFLVELTDLNGREALADYDVLSLIEYSSVSRPSATGRR
jgi:adenine phosphoribosyltransferase